MEQTPLETTLDNFMTVTAKSKVAVIVPLYGYWRDDEQAQLTPEVLKVVLDRIYSSVHQIYMIYTAEPERIPQNIANILLGRVKGGNAKGIKISKGGSYGEYVREGMDYALEETEAQYILIVNPWVMIQQGGIDTLIDRLNHGDDAKIISGYDLRNFLDPERFEEFKAQIPKEERDITFNLAGMTRQIAEMITLDENFHTHKYVERDLWQSMYTKGFEVITSQRIPIFSFEVDWKLYEPEDLVGQDKSHFLEKWGFDPGI